MRYSIELAAKPIEQTIDRKKIDFYYRSFGFDMLRIQPSLLNLFVRRLPCFQNRIYASNTAASRSSNDDDWEDEKKTKTDAQREHEDGEEEAASIASMIGPYMSSKQIAFHTGQFDSEKIQKKNKQAFLVRVFFLLKQLILYDEKSFIFDLIGCYRSL